MYRLGDIVYFDNLKFPGGYDDEKKNRPCVVLFEEDDNIYCFTITSSTKMFNKKPNNFILISNVLYNYHKLSFINLKSMIKRNKNDANYEGKINHENILLLKERIKTLKDNNEKFKFIYDNIENNEEKILTLKK